MNAINMSISLSVKIQGCTATRGRYESSVKTDDQGKVVSQIERNAEGKMEKSDVIQLRTIQLPRNHNCEIHTVLNESFCNWAVSDDARPKKTVSVPWWNKLSPKNKLKMAVQQYVWDLYGRDAEFSFQQLHYFFNGTILRIKYP